MLKKNFKRRQERSTKKRSTVKFMSGRLTDEWSFKVFYPFFQSFTE